jgi:hypothetical protein
LYQVEYAMEAISNAGAAIGMLCTDGVVLVAEKKITSKVRHAPAAAEQRATLLLCRSSSISATYIASSDVERP